jgi:hypothetical protein
MREGRKQKVTCNIVVGQCHVTFLPQCHASGIQLVVIGQCHVTFSPWCHTSGQLIIIGQCHVTFSPRCHTSEIQLVEVYNDAIGQT